MSRAGMAERCRGAEALGVARLAGWRFMVTTDGYASIVRAPGAEVLGVLWRLTARDLAPLNAYESIASGLYGRRTLAVRHADAAKRALVYVARERAEGRPRPGYMESVVAAAREWQLPADYVRALERWAPSGLRAARAVESGETG